MGKFITSVILISTWVLYFFGPISLDTVLIVCMLFGLGHIIHEKR